MKTIAFFNNKGGVGKTSLVYHVAWMLRELGHRVVVADLDPQANLTTFFLSEDKLIDLFEESATNKTIFQAFRPILEATGDLAPVETYEAASGLYLIPGDLSLSQAEDVLSARWADCLSDNPATKSAGFRVECGFYRSIYRAAEERNAQIALIDVGPSLGALNRAALLASDYVVIPLGSDAFSLQGVQNVGTRLREWRTGWKKRSDEAPINLGFELPSGKMQSIGYLLSRFSMRLGRQTQAYQKWASKMPHAYKHSVLGEAGAAPSDPKSDPNCLAELKDYRSLMPMAQETGKPMFKLTVADGAIGAHQSGVKDAYGDFKELTEKILSRL
jgi:chromosome partitioning protein